MNATTSTWKRVGSGIGVAALALGAVAFSASPALAAPGEGGTGTVTVHKFEQPAGDLGANDGTELETSGATPLVAGFAACAIEGIDLGKSADWDRLSNITITPVEGDIPVVEEAGKGELTLKCGAEQMTSSTDGSAAFELDADRAYVVYESTPAANAIAAAQPTLITVPYPGNGAAGQPVWNYQPHIYPKNTVVGSGATKDGVVIGNQVSFDITVPVNPLAKGDNYSELRVNDQLKGFLEYTSGSVVLEGKDGAPVTLDKGTDYTLTEPTGANGVEVVLNFLTPGLAKLDANIGGKIVLTINADAVGTGSTENEATITINGASTDPGTGPQTPDPEEFFAGAYIQKLAKNKGAASTEALAGATFSIVTLDSGATECPAVIDPDETVVFADQVSAADGKTPSQVAAAGKYCVYETGVPAGYKGLSGGMLLEVTGEDSSVDVVNTQIGADEGDLPSLPLTGAAGSVLLVAGGALLLVVGAVLVNARRKQNQAN
ncbi:SpaH/EbpB family LPXTG-anchored major pilin [Leucobacter komagatae]|uniref:Gram-positive cocci surface proteins LPxTG domain-containing protein n=1 Tax=Leucobacter komagatae TaxID=55969 RepID=A0A0D0IQJ7_9MICO|nr:SpaH/EbpB family LPXTG-anchored major pilin [Leucobacter komagatae]KIP51773.1 hypothetical protein SD72_13455 [Leucobacter komagatae]